MSKTKFITLGVLSLLLVGYIAFTSGDGFAVGDIDAQHTSASLQVRAQALAKLPPPSVSVRLALIKTATAKSLEALVYSGGNRWGAFELSHSAILIEHPEGKILFDTGLGVDAQPQFESIPLWPRVLLGYEGHNAALPQLSEQGISASDIKHIILSHMHWDHASGIEDFPSAQVWATDEELQSAREIGDSDSAFIPSQFDDPAIHWQSVKFDGGPYGVFDSSFDMFDDGTIVLVPLAGHTSGGLGMFVNLSSGARYLFIGDTTWAKEGFEHPAHRHWLAAGIVDHDLEHLHRSITRVHLAAKADSELVVIPTHDMRIQQSLGFFPQYIE